MTVRRKVSDEEIVRLYEQVRDGNKVGAMLQVSNTVVYGALKANGIARDGRDRYLARIKLFSDEDANRIVEQYKSGRSALSIAEEYGCSSDPVFSVLKRANVDLRRARPQMSAEEKLKAKKLYEDGLTLNQVAEKLGRHVNSITLLIKNEFPESSRSGMIGPSGPHWRGGRNKDSQGYLYVWIADDDPMQCMAIKNSRYVLEHRLVMARKLGRPLLPTETVHHIDGDKTNNGPENLELRQGKHGKNIVFYCLKCGSYNVGPVCLADA